MPDPTERSPFDLAWLFFSVRACRYARPVVEFAGTIDETFGRVDAIELVERFVAGRTEVEGSRSMEEWRRDRAAACALHRLGELERAAHCLKRSVLAHLCVNGSCLNAPGALAHLYFQLGRPLEALLACTKFTLGVGPLPIHILDEHQARRLVDDLVAVQGNPQVDADAILGLANGLAATTESARARAHDALESYRSSASVVLARVRPTLRPEVRARVDRLLITWAIRSEGERFWASSVS